jgi:recombination protein RecA
MTPPSLASLITGQAEPDEGLSKTPLTDVMASAGIEKPSPTEDKVKLRKKREKDATDKVLSALMRSRPREATGGQADWSRSTERVLSSVKYYLKSNIPSLDVATGYFPFGRVSEIYGLDGAGKTGLAMHLCGMAKENEIYEKKDDGTYVKLDPETYDVTAMFIDNENSLEEGQRMQVCIKGVNKEVDCIIGETDTIDLLFKNIDKAIDTLEQVEKETKRMQLLVVIGDTIASTSTEAEIKQAWGSQDYARQPAQLRQGFRAMIRRIKSRNVCAIFTNQVSDSFKPKAKSFRQMLLPQDSDFSSFGGKALRYYSSLRVFVVKYPSPYKIYGGQFPDGLMINLFVSKNRQIMPLRSGVMVLLFDRGYSEEFSILQHLLYTKMITQGATGNIVINFQKYGINDGMTASLEEADAEEEKGYKHILQKKLDWLEFYKAKKPLVDQLWAKCIEKMFNQNGANLDAEAVDAIAIEDEAVLGE